MKRLLIAVPLVVAMLATSAPAQVRLGPDGPFKAVKPKKVTGSKPSKPKRPELKAYRFHVTPAAEPNLPLRYSLMPPRTSLKAGNSVPFYYRAVLSLKDRKEWNNTKFWEETWPRWTEGPVDKLPKAEMRKFLKRFDSALAELNIAAHRDHTDWAWRLEDMKGVSSIAFLLPEIQEMRSFARLLNLKIRLELAEGRWDDAIKSMQIGYKLAVDTAEPPTLINDLVGVAIGAIMTHQLRDMINQPNSPNMYWALSTLPRPYVDMRPAIEYEMTLPVKLFPALKDPETAEHSPEEWSRLLSDAFLNLGIAEGTPMRKSSQKRLMARLATTALAMKNYGRVKRTS